MTPEERLRSDFVFFLAMIWKHLGLPRPTPVQKDMALHLQNGSRRMVIEAFRGVGKSFITSAFVLWQLYRDPNIKILVVSASKDRSDAFTIFTKRLLEEVPFLAHLRPDPSRGDRDSNINFDVRPASAAHAPSVKSVGITGQVTGSRADLIVVDDVEVPNNSESALMREKLLMRVRELGGAVLTPKAQAGESGGIVFLGTPQVEDSLYNKLPEMGYDVRIWPAELPADEEKYRGYLAPMVALMATQGQPTGTPTDPLRFDQFELEERRIEYGAAGYALQFMLDTTLTDADRTPLKLRDLMLFDTDVDVAPDRLTWGSADEQVIEGLPQIGLPGDRWFRPAFTAEHWTPYNTTVMYIDPHGRGKDETGYAVIKELHGLLFVRRWGGLAGGYDENTLTKLATIARDEKVNTIMVESNFGDGMWTQLFLPVLRRIYVTKHGKGCAVEEENVSGQKELRTIDTLEPVLNAHRMVMDTGIARRDTQNKQGSTDPEAALKSCFYQLTRITREKGSLKYDDRIDALAGCVRVFTQKMASDVDTQAAQEHDNRLEKELEKIRDHWFGKRPSSKTWGGRMIVR